MSAALAIFVAKLTDPLGVLIALAFGAFGRSKKSIVIGGLATAVIIEVLLLALSKIDGFAIGPFLLGVVAYSMWCVAGYLLFRRMMGVSSK